MFTGFQTYTVIHAENKGDGEFVYAVKKLADREEDVMPVLLTLSGGRKKDPLNKVKNCKLKIQHPSIVGIDLDGECVIRTDIV